MRKLLNTLFVSTQGMYLHRESETLVAKYKKKIVLRLPVHSLAGIVCFGNVLCTPFLLGLCNEKGVLVSFLTEQGKFLARVAGPVSGNVLLRREQIRAADRAEIALEIARSCIIGKLANCRTVLLRAARDHDKYEEIKPITDNLAFFIRKSQFCNDIDTLRGYEGEGSKQYFATFNHMILHQKNYFQMENRNRRPPLDPLNALLSFLYTLLTHDCTAAAEATGLDPQIGFLHKARSGRASLALDLMEEFRPMLADRVALSLINLKQIDGKKFKYTESGAVLMDDTTRKNVLLAWQKKKKEEITHPFINKKIPIGLLPYVQAQLLARFLRGDIDTYPPFLLK